MSSLEQLIRFGEPNSGRLFRSAVYRADEDASLVADCLALANADVSASRRFIFFGIDDAMDGSRSLIGVDTKSLTEFKRRFLALLKNTVEPELNATVRSVAVDDRLIAYIRIKHCTSRPYLTRRTVGGQLGAGVGFIQHGRSQKLLMRADLKRLFAESEVIPAPKAPVVVQFAGKKPSLRVTIPVLGLEQLPSQLAAERLLALLGAKSHSRALLGRTQTQLSRLMHARVYGVDKPFEKHSDESLRDCLGNVDADYRAADQHYSYEIRAHKLNLRVSNTTEKPLHNANLRLTVSRMPGFGIAERIFAELEDNEAVSSYPQVTAEKHTFLVNAVLGTLLPGDGIVAFREPLRIWAREEAAGQSAAIEYTLTADELPDSVTGHLVISVDAGNTLS